MMKAWSEYSIYLLPCNTFLLDKNTIYIDEWSTLPLLQLNTHLITITMAISPFLFYKYVIELYNYDCFGYIIKDILKNERLVSIIEM